MVAKRVTRVTKDEYIYFSKVFGACHNMPIGEREHHDTNIIIKCLSLGHTPIRHTGRLTEQLVKEGIGIERKFLTNDKIIMTFSTI